MAMDREKLLAFFQAHYLSRQEVLFKLPLNVSIGYAMLFVVRNDNASGWR